MTEKDKAAAAKAVEWYNRIMIRAGYEMYTIGLPQSIEYQWNVENKRNCLWTLRDMVAECDSVLSTLCEFDGPIHSTNSEIKRNARNAAASLRRFICKYASTAVYHHTCYQWHASKYCDNKYYDK